MKSRRLIYGIALFLGLLSLTACFDNTADDKKNLTFENFSRATVRVIPLTIEWVGFTLAPGERKELGGVRDADFRYEPANRVQEGSASTARYIVFVDAPPAPAI